MNWKQIDTDDYIMKLDGQVSLYAYCPREGAPWKWQVNGLGETLKGRCETEGEAKATAIKEAHKTVAIQIDKLTVMRHQLEYLRAGGDE